MRTVHNFDQNQLLAALPKDEQDRLRDDLDLIAMPLGHPLYESGANIGHVYFPTTALVSLLYDTDDGYSTEVATIGDEGIVGVALFLGGETTLSRAVVQSAGHGYRMQGKSLKREFHRAAPMQSLLLRYTQALMTEVAQTLVCTRRHTIDQQFCRWLLLRFDRLSSNKLVASHEQIANMLGVRRAAITEIAGRLRTAGLITYIRGHITVTDRKGLEKRSCECYATIKDELVRLTPSATV